MYCGNDGWGQAWLRAYPGTTSSQLIYPSACAYSSSDPNEFETEDFCISSGQTFELDYEYTGSGDPSDITIYVTGDGSGYYSGGYSWSADTWGFSDTCY